MARPTPHPRRPPVQLFALLTHLGIDQRTLASRLGVSRPLVSRWASGDKAIATHHDTALQEVIVSAMEAAIPRQAPGRPAASVASLEETISLVKDWLRERYETTGTLYEDLYTHYRTLCQVLGPPGEAPRHDFSLGERQALLHTATQLRATLQVLERLAPVEAAIARQRDARRCVNE